MNKLSNQQLEHYIQMLMDEQKTYENCDYRKWLGCEQCPFTDICVYARKEAIRKAAEVSKIKNWIKSELKELNDIKDKYEKEKNTLNVIQQVMKYSENLLQKSNVSLDLGHLKEKERNCLKNLSELENKIERIDQWLSCLSDVQKMIVQKYVIDYKCQKSLDASIELGYSERRIFEAVKQAIQKIFETYYKECSH